LKKEKQSIYNYQSIKINVIKLEDILNGVDVLETMGNLDIAISGIAFDSRQVLKGNLFIAVCGTQVDGHHFIDQAIKNGAIAIICQKIPKKPEIGIAYLKVKNSAIALGKIASSYFGNPSSPIQLVGITGTNGKTTTATMLYNLF